MRGLLEQPSGSSLSCKEKCPLCDGLAVTANSRLQLGALHLRADRLARPFVCPLNSDKSHKAGRPLHSLLGAERRFSETFDRQLTDAESVAGIVPAYDRLGLESLRRDFLRRVNDVPRHHGRAGAGGAAVIGEVVCLRCRGLRD